MFRFTFDFEPIQKKVYNFRIYEINTTSMINSKTEDAQVEVTSSHLHFNKIARILLQVTTGDRVIIKYYQSVFNDGSIEIFPVISKLPDNSISQGNRITSTGTVIYKGKQSDVLLKYGNMFKLEPYQEGLFKLVPTIQDNGLENTPTEKMDEVYSQ